MRRALDGNGARRRQDRIDTPTAILDAARRP